ncbi:hypothetical protein ABH931_003043 [Streptacidiphilus sp. MAP12-33]|uniref:hypothetical protein n=1 Tax=Streptacidiphilus sp. MAP12-33 TaxID=3156266 RepID=UPI003517C411
MRYRGGDEPGDGPEDLFRRLAQRDHELLSDVAFPVYAPTAPALAPLALAGYQVANGELVKVDLVHGDWFVGPLVQVTSLTPGAGGDGVTEASALLEDLLAVERERPRTSGAAPDGPDAREPAEEGPAEIVVGGVPAPAILRREGPIWVARLRAPDGQARLLVTGRGVPPEQVALGVVTELGPYAEGRQTLLTELTARNAARAKKLAETSEPEAEEPLGLADHRRLVDVCVADALRVEAAVRAHRLPLSTAAEGREQRGLWERAVRQQMRLAGEDRFEADESVTAMVNHLSSLAQHADWFTDPASADAAEAAVEESIRFTALASEVRSAPAQRAWLRQWHHLDEPPIPLADVVAPEERRLRVELVLQARATWLDLWRAWLSERTDDTT